MTDNTRLFRHQNNVYKIRISFAPSSHKLSDAVSFEIIEPAIRAVLYAEERGRTISKIEIEDIIVSYTKKYWKASEKLGFRQYGKTLEAYPYLLIFTVECQLPWKKTQSQKREKYGNQRDVSHSARESLNKTNTSRKQPVVVLSKLNLRSDWLASNQSRSSKRQPVVVLDRLSLPVSKKPETGFKENKLRTSPRRKTTDPDLSSAETSERRKRHRDTISDENLPFCRAAKISKLSPRKERREYRSPGNVFTQRINIPISPAKQFSKDKKTDNISRQQPVDDLSMSPVIPLQKIDHLAISPSRNMTKKSDSGFDEMRSPRRQTCKSYKGHSSERLRRQPLPRASDNEEDSRLNRLRSPRNNSQILPNYAKAVETDVSEKKKGQRSVGSSSPVKEKHKRTSSGFWQLIETIMTPVKLLTRKQSK